MMQNEYKSKKSHSVFIVKGDKDRAYLIASGEAATLPKVLKAIERVRKEGGDFATVDWTARQLSNTY